MKNLTAKAKPDMEEQNRIQNSGRKLYQLGQADLRAELVKRIEEMRKIELPFFDLDPAYFKKIGYIKALDAVLLLIKQQE